MVVIDSKEDPSIDKSMVLVYELTHALRRDYGLQTDSPTGGGINKIEEAYAVQVENQIRYELGKELRTDGDSREDVNKDGKADGDGSYGSFGIEVPAPYSLRAAQNKGCHSFKFLSISIKNISISML